MLARVEKKRYLCRRNWLTTSFAVHDKGSQQFLLSPLNALAQAFIGDPGGAFGR